MSDAEQKVLDGSAWDEFCDALKDAGRIVRSDHAPGDAFNQAEGYRYLTRLLRGGLESYLEFADPLFPVFRCGAHETIKLGADNPDNRYESAAIRPEFDYRITGKRNTVDYLGISSIVNKYGSGGTMEVTGHIDHKQLQMDAEGNFEIIVSRQAHPGNWLPMAEHSNSITVRQTFQDRVAEVPAQLRIERIGAGEQRPAPLTPDKLVRGLQGATLWVQGAATLFENWAESFLPAINQLPPADQDYCQSIGGDPNIFYFHSAWRLQEDEVMVITAPQIPACQTWNFQLNNWWMESLDYRYHRIHVNKHTAHYDADGSVRLYVAHSDPQRPNWIETAGHNTGTMCWRWIGATEHPLVDVTVVKRADLT